MSVKNSEFHVASSEYNDIVQPILIYIYILTANIAIWSDNH